MAAPSRAPVGVNAVTADELDNLVEQHYDRLFRAARFMCGSLQVAEDLVQATFLAAVEARSRFRGRSSDYTWLYGILLNKFRRWLRRRKRSFLSFQHLARAHEDRSGAETLEADQPGPVQELVQRESAGQVRRALDELPADHRAVLTLRYVEDLSYQEIAEVIGCPLGTVKSRIHYALQKIAEELSDA